MITRRSEPILRRAGWDPADVSLAVEAYEDKYTPYYAHAPLHIHYSNMNTAL